MPLFTCKAVLLDLDGVLVDSTPCVTRVWRTWANEHGLDAEHIGHITHGLKAIELIRMVAPRLDAEREMRKVEQMEIDDTDGLRVLPGARELLEKLPTANYTIVTSGTRRLATRRLEVVGLPVPSKMITADEVIKGKPDPEPYLAGATSLGVTADECVVFEDAPSGILSAKAAGATTIGISTTYKPEGIAAADLVIPSLTCVRVLGENNHKQLRLEIAGISG